MRFVTFLLDSCPAVMILVVMKIPTSARGLALCFASSLFLTACNQPSTQTVELPVFVSRPAYAWKTGPASPVGLDSAALISQLQMNSAIKGFSVVRDSMLVFEYYPLGVHQENDFDIRSASKSLLSALVGITLRQGALDSVGQKILPLFPEFDTTGLDPRKREITLEHLLTMRAGFDYIEGGNYSHIYTPTAFWAHVTLNLPLKFDPGSAFSYATPQSHLLSVILARTTGASVYLLAEESLFGPLQISVRDWYRDPQGFFYGGTGMSMTLRDVARFGFLYLQQGLVEHRRILDGTWIETSIRARNTTGTTWGALSSVNYGYHWWTATAGADSLFMAAGYGGQFCFIIPQKSLVVASVADSDVPPEVASAQELFVIDILVNHVLAVIPPP